METLSKLVNLDETRNPQANTRFNLNMKEVKLLRSEADIQIIQERSRGAKRYSIRLNDGIIVGSAQESKGRYEIELLDSDKNKRNFTENKYNAIKNIREVAQGIESGEIREYVKEVPKLHVTPPKKRIRARGLRMFQPIKDNNGNCTAEYIELTNRTINGLTLISYRKVNLESGRCEKWKYEFIQPRYLQITDQRQQSQRAA